MTPDGPVLPEFGVSGPRLVPIYERRGEFMSDVAKGDLNLMLDKWTFEPTVFQ